MIDLDTYEGLKRRAEETQRESDRAQGRLDAALRDLKREHGVATIEDAEKKLAKLKKRHDEAHSAFGAALEAFQKKWRDALD